MRIKSAWILFLMPNILVDTQPVRSQESAHNINYRYNDHKSISTQSISNQDNSSISPENEQIISVRITSSVAVGRGKIKSGYVNAKEETIEATIPVTTSYDPTTDTVATIYDVTTSTYHEIEPSTDVSPSLAGANFEYIKQLQAKKALQNLNSSGNTYSSHDSQTSNFNDTKDSLESLYDSDTASTVDTEEIIKMSDGIDDNVPLARSIPSSYSSKKFLHRHSDTGQKLTTVSFNVVHDSSKANSYNEHSSSYPNAPQHVAGLQKLFQEPSNSYSEPAKIYSEPAKFYSEPAKVYGEPAKIYGEPAKVYSEPAKIYSEPAKFYSPAASLNLTPEKAPNRDPWIQNTRTTLNANTLNTTPSVLQTNRPYDINKQTIVEHQPEKNYEVDEKISVMTDGRSHGVQTNNPDNCKQDSCKVGYVVEGRQYRKYRVEERTSDGFIVGEYGVVRNEDGALRGVRYTADSEASPRLIHDALMKFLQLK
ncbi:unnamed protein product [Leptidea sinapis]|uniref:Uncharacterized protein n=1 Tax=Leptidea sinapis TaxID=189913 RepID=A0A5E4R3M3_9NEOP|nr:unnamed protein product [Leptidea sinapis]